VVGITRFHKDLRDALSMALTMAGVKIGGIGPARGCTGINREGWDGVRKRAGIGIR
jgi:hypothetical protein